MLFTSGYKKIREQNYGKHNHGWGLLQPWRPFYFYIGYFEYCEGKCEKLFHFFSNQPTQISLPHVKRRFENRNLRCQPIGHAHKYRFRVCLF